MPASVKVMDTSLGNVLVDGKGMTLYGWVKDTKSGDVTGDGVGKVWHAAKP